MFKLCSIAFDILSALNASSDLFFLFSSTSNVYVCKYNTQFRPVHVTHLIKCFISDLPLVSARSHFQG